MKRFVAVQDPVQPLQEKIKELRTHLSIAETAAVQARKQVARALVILATLRDVEERSLRGMGALAVELRLAERALQKAREGQGR